MDVVDLSACTLLFKGTIREVYQHPADPGLLIKVIRRERVGPNGELHVADKMPLFERFRTYGIYISFVRELNEFLRFSCRSYNKPQLRFPVARILSLTPTTQGLGLVVEKVTQSSGQIAPTLAWLIARKQVTRQHRERVDQFITFCAENHIVLGDLNAGNLVYDDRGDGRFVCIDGVGEKTAIPVHRWFKTINAAKLRRSQRKLHVRIDAALA